MFNRTTYNKESNNLVEYIDNPSIKYKRRMSGNNKPVGTVTKRGFSGFHEPEAVSVTKMKYCVFYVDSSIKCMQVQVRQQNLFSRALEKKKIDL